MDKYAFKSGKVSWRSPDFSEYRAAHWWGIDLERWFQIGREARAAMIATFEADGLLAAGGAQEEMNEHERKANLR